ncbi:MAG: hypothetical protein HZB15_03105 [Actinobacteria bacterium]|nr:hypothetical protein [Actinomycetota bacterium]
MWLVHVRSFVARHRAVYWGVVGALCLAVALALMAQSRQLRAAREAWGTSVEVWVAAESVEPGDPLPLERAELPLAAVPDAAVTGTVPAGAVARQRISQGEVVVASDLATGRLPGLTADRRAVSIAIDETSLVVEVGEHVDVVASGVVVAADGVVAAVGPASVTVGVATHDAAAVATAAADGTAVLVLRPEG